MMAADKRCILRLCAAIEAENVLRSSSRSFAGEDIRGALNDVLAGNAVQRPIKPSVGCSIKWHP